MYVKGGWLKTNVANVGNGLGLLGFAGDVAFGLRHSL
ncbi:hypothetical protein CCACVL1_30170 [Corchorus capsularis]|uniref:Uncharacterized protein n=1 Tax=Corchorus capsularis TaxID=210143 RepID=A0A1R3FYH7_COCAP|nr:hypothetical protein CCACVL1_30170 [Corchorus capsularis]